MTRYLDRQPIKGDQVEVNFVGTVTHGGSYDCKVRYLSAEWFLERADVRVIAPEPEVGDVVTADMDLPNGSIIEGGPRDPLAVRIQDEGHARQIAQNVAGYGDTWRIVRIGGAS